MARSTIGGQYRWRALPHFKRREVRVLLYSGVDAWILCSWFDVVFAKIPGRSKANAGAGCDSRRGDSRREPFQAVSPEGITGGSRGRWWYRKGHRRKPWQAVAPLTGLHFEYNIVAQQKSVYYADLLRVACIHNYLILFQ